jgi:hypothetical protein
MKKRISNKEIKVEIKAKEALAKFFMCQLYKSCEERERGRDGETKSDAELFEIQRFKK